MATARTSDSAAFFAGLAALMLSSSVPAFAEQPYDDPDAREELALMGTVPLYWGEAANISEMISGHYRAHWARAALEQNWQLVPISTLTANFLARQRSLMLLQPRGLTPQENVALDDWVAAGGRLLLFADPMMTGESRFGIGDRRRPQDIALLSPILARWGLRLELPDAQDDEVRLEASAVGPLPVALPGRFVRHGEGVARCVLDEPALIASCTRGAGRMVLVADAALLDLEGPHEGAPVALDQLVTWAFATSSATHGENAGHLDQGTLDIPQIDAKPPISDQSGELTSGQRDHHEPREKHVIP